MTPSNYRLEIQNLIAFGKRPNEIAKILNLNYVSTQSYIKTNFNINFSRTYYIEHPDYFSQINTHAKAYWLGFIAADGYLITKYSNMGIQLSIKDKVAVEKFKNELGSKIPLLIIKERVLNVNNKTYIGNKMIRFTIGNKQLYNDLIHLGIVPQKSMIIGNIIENIPYQYRNAFIIGYFDGDGSISLPKERLHHTNDNIYQSHRTTISIRGTKLLLTGIKNHLQLNNKLVFNKTFILNIGSKKDVVKFLSCYNNLPFFLYRKFDKLISRMQHFSYDKFIQEQTISSSLISQ
jgi:intein/homing endonuclease